MREESSPSKSAFFSETGKAIGISIIFTLASVLLFALIIKLFNLDQGVIKPVNQFLKVISIFTGCFFCFRQGKGFLKGAFVGILVVLLTFFIFAIIAGSISFTSSFLIELLFGALIGGISGIITVNLKR